MSLLEYDEIFRLTLIGLTIIIAVSLGYFFGAVGFLLGTWKMWPALQEAHKILEEQRETIRVLSGRVNRDSNDTDYNT